MVERRRWRYNQDGAAIETEREAAEEIAGAAEDDIAAAVAVTVVAGLHT